jgi:hypothetical protein
MICIAHGFDFATLNKNSAIGNFFSMTLFIDATD